jgi:hypothetical protein
MDLFDTLTFAKILVETTFLDTPTLTILLSVSPKRYISVEVST